MPFTPLHPGRSSTPPRIRLRQVWLARRPAVGCALLALASAGITGCQGMAMYSNLHAAQLRVIDASPDAGVIDSYGNNGALAYNLSFGAITNYIPLSPGDYRLTADRAGTRQILVTNNQRLAADQQYTEIIGASLANMRQTIFHDRSTPAPQGEIAVRVINETTRPGSLNVSMVSLASPDDKTIRSSSLAVNLGSGASSGYVLLPMGTYAIHVTSSAASPSAPASLLSGAQQPYPSGAVRTVVLIDQTPPSPQQPLPQPSVQAIIAADADA
ncbi:MAG: DUF4397 domain-containing protein [Acidobacteriaceae bacterium]